MPIGLLGALLGGALMGGARVAAGALGRPRIPRGVSEGLAYQNLLLREYGLPLLRDYTVPALRRRSELESALWPLIAARLKDTLAPAVMSPQTQSIYRAARRGWLQELAEAKKRVAMDLAARGGIRSGAYPRRLEALERDTASGLAALYADLARRRRNLALNLASSILAAGPSYLTLGQVSRLADSLGSRAARMGGFSGWRNSALADALTAASSLLAPVISAPMRA